MNAVARFAARVGVAWLLAVSSSASAFRDCAACPEMVAIPAGEFRMGTAASEEARENLADEYRGRSEPPRTVAVEAFSASRYEITRGQYREFAEASARAAGCFVWTRDEFELQSTLSWRDPGFAQEDTHPATCVSWDDAIAYTEWLSRLTGRRYRLLTEAEWEYAARAGTNTSRYWSDDARRQCEFANGADRTTAARVPGAKAWATAECDDRYAYTAPAGRYRPNAFGLYDMLGNVEEWTSDCWRSDYSSGARVDCGMRAVRGGSWLDAPVGLRSAYRVGSPASVRVYRRGFRVAVD